uniref:lethal(2) giant larvae protein homolog 1-like isoform X2 n=1 Tax=Myxine glutinosa TaxID=7769 RepID=UPI00358E435B
MMPLKRATRKPLATVQHGFPHQPSALAYDQVLQIMAIGTKNGSITIYGAPGVEFSARYKEVVSIMQLHFLPGQGRIVALLDNSLISLWEVLDKGGQSELCHKQDFTIPCQPGALPSVTRPTALCVSAAGDKLYIGSEAGSVHVLQLSSSQFDDVLSQEGALQSLPEEYRVGKALGAVEAIREDPRASTSILVGYTRGLLLLWDLNRRSLQRCLPGTQQLESVHWSPSGQQVTCSYSDGSYQVWSLDDSEEQRVPSLLYGPYPCKAITKIQRFITSGCTFVVFSGGMPRASFGDRHCVTVMHEHEHVAFDFTSRVVDFFTVSGAKPGTVLDEPKVLVVLVEEELVAIDLMAPGWPSLTPPYLASLHSSAITCSHHVSAIPSKLWERIVACGVQQKEKHSSAEWPINGGVMKSQKRTSRDLLLTGHEDGSVRFWDASGVALQPLYKLSTASVFVTEADQPEPIQETDEGHWPPFRKVGCFDPYSDDPRLGIQKISLCKFSGQLALAGSAGQVLLMELNDESTEHEINTYTMDLLEENETFRWKGHDRLIIRSGPVPLPAGYQPQLVVQAMPPASLTALALQAEWHLLAFGTSHGFGLFDCHQRKSVLTKCTLHPNDALALEGPLSRVKSLKKSLRQSFRRMRKSRTTARKRPDPTTKVREANARLAEQDLPGEVELAPVQRRVEARSPDDSFTGMVKCLYFADTFLRDGSHHGPSLWAGTNAGVVYAYSLEIPTPEHRNEQPIHARFGKEIQLMHRAPVLALAVLDGKSSPLPEPLEVLHDLAKSPDLHGHHSLLIVSEEQFKIFMLPKVNSKHKFKLTATEGSRIRKASLVWLGTPPSGNSAGTSGIVTGNDEAVETCLVCLTNQGDVHGYSLPSLRLQARFSCMRKEDVTGISSCVFTHAGQGFYLISPSQFERFSVSAASVTELLCSLQPREPAAIHPLPIPEYSPTVNQVKPEDAVGTKKRGRVMENALLTDSRVLEEIQETLNASPPIKVDIDMNQNH